MYVQIEQLTPSTDGHDISGQIDISAHGTDGPLAISLPNYSLHVDNLIERAATKCQINSPLTKTRTQEIHLASVRLLKIIILVSPFISVL